MLFIYHIAQFSATSNLSIFLHKISTTNTAMDSKPQKNCTVDVVQKLELKKKVIFIVN